MLKRLDLRLLRRANKSRVDKLALLGTNTPRKIHAKVLQYVVSQYETGPQSKQDQIPADFILKSCRPGKSSPEEKNAERGKEEKERNKEKEKEIKNLLAEKAY